MEFELFGPVDISGISFRHELEPIKIGLDFSRDERRLQPREYSLGSIAGIRRPSRIGRQTLGSWSLGAAPCAYANTLLFCSASCTEFLSNIQGDAPRCLFGQQGVAQRLGDLNGLSY